VMIGAVVFALLLAVAGCTATRHPSTTQAPLGVGSGLFGRPLEGPEVTVAASGLYVTWQVSPPTATVQLSELARADATTGRIQATIRLGAAFDQAVDAAGSLWVTTSSTAGLTLLRLDPLDLQPAGRWALGGGSNHAFLHYDLAVAGGYLWIAAGNRLLRMALPAGGVALSVSLPGAASSDVAADTAGTVLFDGEANDEGAGMVQRRDPTTGALLGSYPMVGVAAPVIAGATGFGVWVSEATGMMGYVERLDATTLEPSPADRSACREGNSTPTCIEGTNGITATLADGLVWVTQTAGGSARNYCANPSSGEVLASLALPQPAQDYVLAIDPHQIYYTFYAPGGSRLDRQPIPPACRTT
jgi:hypothetical protein